MTSARNKPKYVYVIGAPGSATVKIGITTSVADRLRQIQSMSPVELEVLWARPGSQELERSLHRHFADHRSHGEWFTFDDDAVDLVKNAIKSGLVFAPVEDAEASSEPHQLAAKQELPFLERCALEGLRRHYAGVWVSVEEAARTLMFSMESMRRTLDALADKGKVVRGPERPLWLYRQYALVIGSQT